MVVVVCDVVELVVAPLGEAGVAGDVVVVVLRVVVLLCVRDALGVSLLLDAQDAAIAANASAIMEDLIITPSGSCPGSLRPRAAKVPARDCDCPIGAARRAPGPLAPVAAAASTKRDRLARVSPQLAPLALAA